MPRLSASAPPDDRTGGVRPRATGTGLRRAGLPFSPAVEDYAKALYRLEQLTGGPVSTGALAARLDVSAPSASNMVRHLEELGLVRVERGSGAGLTPAGRRVARGRYYFDCGPVILGILDYPAEVGSALSSPTEALYFATSDLEGLYERARDLRCLSSGLIHNDPASPLGEIVVRPWGERSFYAEDPSGNPLCFVDERTLFTGSPRRTSTARRGPSARRLARRPRRRHRAK